jgi:hypothetical protein
VCFKAAQNQERHRVDKHPIVRTTQEKVRERKWRPKCETNMVEWPLTTRREGIDGGGGASVRGEQRCKFETPRKLTQNTHTDTHGTHTNTHTRMKHTPREKRRRRMYTTHMYMQIHGDTRARTHIHTEAKWGVRCGNEGRMGAQTREKSKAQSCVVASSVVACWLRQASSTRTGNNLEGTLIDELLNGCLWQSA